MSRFTVILPEGTVILKNEETGQILRLSAESGPLVLGEIEMSMTLGPRPLEVAGAAHAPAVAAAQARDAWYRAASAPDSGDRGRESHQSL